MDPLYLALSCAAISSFAGIAAAMRSGKATTARDYIAAVIYSAAFGVSWGCLLAEKFADSPYLLIGTSGFVGLGGATLIDFVVQWIGGRLQIKVEVKTDEQDENGSGV